MMSELGRRLVPWPAMVAIGSSGSSLIVLEAFGVFETPPSIVLQPVDIGKASESSKLIRRPVPLPWVKSLERSRLLSRP